MSLHRCVQVCSAIHNQEFTLVEDYIAGLQALLYLQVCEHVLHTATIIIVCVDKYNIIIHAGSEGAGQLEWAVSTHC